MSDYTPTADEVRNYYERGVIDAGGIREDSRGNFDRWLAAHDAEVRADEREKAAKRVAIIPPFPVEMHGGTLDVIPKYNAIDAARGEGTA